MSENNVSSQYSVNLREAAEEILKQKSANANPLSALEAEQMLHELQVHQIELEMQNEELRRTQAELEISRNRYTELFDFAPLGYLTFNEQGLILESNLAAAMMLGVVRSRLVDRRLAQFILPADKDIYGRFCQVLFNSGLPQICELRIVKNDGTSFWARLDATLVQDKLGKPVCHVTLSDITASKQAESQREAAYAALRESEIKLVRSQKIVKMGSWEWDSLTDQVVYTDEIFNIFGIEKEHFGGDFASMVADIIHPQDRELVAQVGEKARQTGVGQTVEYRIIRPDGEVCWIKAIGEFIYENGKLVKMIGINQDITEIKQVEEEKRILVEQLLQAQKMESVGRLAGGIAHDFNNWLSVILGRAEMAVAKTAPDQAIHHDLVAIINAVRHSSELTHQLLAFARKQTIHPIVLDLNAAITNMLGMLQRLMGENIQLVFNPDHELWHVRLDPSQLDQILANLLINAQDAIARAGSILIETSNIVSTEADCAVNGGLSPDDYCLLTVSDNGCGMDDETLAHIFEPFYTTKEVGKGTGLGLATVFGIVKQNKGDIQVNSQPGKGTTFRIYLPRVDEDVFVNPPVNLVPVRLEHGATETVLLVEDEEPLLELQKDWLEDLGYRVLATSSPVEALRLVQEHGTEIHVLVTDMMMPGMNGRELAEQLCPILPELKCVFMSGYTDEIVTKHGFLTAGTAFIQKPFSLATLSTKLSEILGQQS